jgi:hypothetical protein
MKQKPPKKHHFVPQFYLKGFVDSEGLLWVYDRKDRLYRHLPPKTTCCEEDLYAIKPKTAPRDRRIESEYLSSIDGMGASVIRELQTKSTAKPPMNLDASQVRALSMFAAIQFTRLPWFKKAMSAIYESTAEQAARIAFATQERAARVLGQLEKAIGEPSGVTPESMVEAVQGRRLTLKATERPFLQNMIQQSESIAKVIESLDWQVLIAPGSSGFITSDNPLVLVAPKEFDSERFGDGIGFGIPGAIKYFPLTRRLCLRLGDLDSGFVYTNVDSEMVRVVNHNVAAHSDRFIIGPDRNQLESVIIRSHSTDLEPGDRFTVETVRQDQDRALQKFTIRRRRDFYPKGT